MQLFNRDLWAEDANAKESLSLGKLRNTDVKKVISTVLKEVYNEKNHCHIYSGF